MTHIMKEVFKDVYILKSKVRDLINIATEAPTEPFKDTGLSFYE